eukprot:symbB.v1.2.030415.t1/scaffold3220.1/size60884/2
MTADPSCLAQLGKAFLVQEDVVVGWLVDATCVFSLRSGGQLAGGAIVRENEFKHFGVAKELRGSGSSLSLLHAIEADLFQKGYLQVVLVPKNDTAEACWAYNGFRCEAEAALEQVLAAGVKLPRKEEELWGIADIAHKDGAFQEEDGSSEMSDARGFAVGAEEDEEEDEEEDGSSEMSEDEEGDEAKMMDLETRLKEAKEEEGAPKATPMPNLMTQLRGGAKELKPPEKQNEKHLSIEQRIKQLNASASRPDTV